MSISKKKSSQVSYPTKEWAAAFTSGEGAPFRRVSIGVTYPYAGYKISRREGHRINVFEYVLEGAGEILVNGEWQRVEAGQIYVLPAGISHEYRADPNAPWKKIWINYIADYMPGMLRDYGIAAGIYTADGASALFDELLKYAAGGQIKGVNYAIAECVHGIIHLIARARHDRHDDRLHIKDALIARTYEKLNLDELASELHLSKSQLIRSFKRQYGVTPYEYFIELKINAAKVLLRDTNMRISEISDRLSVSDEHYFSTLFRARTGMSPREYRDSKRK